MSVFVDTSALLALLDVKEEYYDRAGQVWTRLAREQTQLFCTSYVLSETVSLVQRRLGMYQVHAFHENVFPFLRIVWVDEALHETGMTAVLAANRRQLSLVDCVSFAAMRRLDLQKVFAFDAHFREQGFTVLDR